MVTTATSWTCIRWPSFCQQEQIMLTLKQFYFDSTLIALHREPRRPQRNSLCKFHQAGTYARAHKHTIQSKHINGFGRPVWTGRSHEEVGVEMLEIEYRGGVRCSGRHSLKDGKMDGYMLYISNTKIWFSARTKFSMTEPIRRIFNKRLWYFKSS